MLRGYTLFILLLVVLYGSGVEAQILDRADVQSFIQKMVSEHDFDARRLRDVFKDVRESDSVLQAITRPAVMSVVFCRVRRCRRLGSLGRRAENSEGTACPRIALDLNSAMMQLDHSLDYCQSEPQPPC